ncbi:uncharacterized protein JCM6883_003438 [Sporobolomyces salmoneus]|uniref:uncharacterized protein n=1 Tax=Sporobolomyces salmoneus TaxID=183962 RepID=UPI00316F9D50
MPRRPRGRHEPRFQPGDRPFSKYKKAVESLCTKWSEEHPTGVKTHFGTTWSPDDWAKSMMAPGVTTEEFEAWWVKQPQLVHNAYYRRVTTDDPPVDIYAKLFPGFEQAFAATAHKPTPTGEENGRPGDSFLQRLYINDIKLTAEGKISTLQNENLSPDDIDSKCRDTVDQILEPWAEHDHQLTKRIITLKNFVNRGETGLELLSIVQSCQEVLEHGRKNNLSARMLKYLIPTERHMIALGGDLGRYWRRFVDYARIPKSHAGNQTEIAGVPPSFEKKRQSRPCSQESSRQDRLSLQEVPRYLEIGGRKYETREVP